MGRSARRRRLRGLRPLLGRGLGGTPATLLAVISDRNTLEYRTDEQPAGTYRFALAYRDSAGNESAIGTVLEEVVPQRPPAVDNFALSYSDSTRRVTLTWDTPSGGWSSNVRRLVIFDNWCPGCSWLAPYANSDPAFRRGDVAKTETSWTSDNLWQGRDSSGALAPWRFDVRALLCDELGSDWGPSVAEELMLALDSGTLGEVSAAPVRPELLAVEPIAGAKYRARWRVGSLANITGFQVVRDGSEVSSVATVSGQFDYADDSGALSDGTTYQVAVRAYNGSDSYSQSATLPVTVDGTAPTGDGVLSGGLCN